MTKTVTFNLPNRIATDSDGIRWKIKRVIDDTAEDLHHIMGQKYRKDYNVNISRNKKKIKRVDHDDWNVFVKDKQNPRDGFKKVFELTKEILSEGVRRELYTIFYETDDNLFYTPELIKGKNSGATKKKEKR